MSCKNCGSTKFKKKKNRQHILVCQMWTGNSFARQVRIKMKLPSWLRFNDKCRYAEKCNLYQKDSVFCNNYSESFHCGKNRGWNQK